jgi:CheY-like chemotaxis protein
MTTKRLLVVDDDERIREVVKMCLIKIAKWQVTIAKSGQEAISTAMVEQPDAILLDVSMPNLNGIETLQQLQLNDRTNSIPVIFLTAKVLRAEQLYYQQLGVAGFIAKPFDPLQIATEISRILNWK